MPVSFSEIGPTFPDELINDLLEGRVVFLCGAGVSTPQLPGFKTLVEQVYARLNADQEPAEAHAFEAGRFEEVLGALSRRMSNPAAVQRAVHDLLQLDHPDLANHQTLLRLSKDLQSRPALVTTNFETLFEQAFEAEEGEGRARPMSLAGQALPAPGGADFCGIIHLHGRLGHAALALDPSPLVMTSAEYGDAYMRSGWASRFLFDLIRCRTLVLIGYQAGDAPVRYFLNVLEADRERFEDLETVYAFDAVEPGAAPNEDRWATVAVHPLRFQKASGASPFGPLWTDLAALAELVETPRPWRRAQVARLVSKPLAEATPRDLDLIAWLLRGKKDLWDIVIPTAEDFRWFDYFTDQRLWEPSDAAWVLAAWCAQDWGDQERLQAAAAWLKQFGEPFADQLDNRLGAGGADLTLRAWRLLSTGARPLREINLQVYRIRSRLDQGPMSDQDLQTLVLRLRPRIDISAMTEWNERANRSPKRLHDLFHLRLTLDDRGDLVEVMDLLLKHAPIARLCEVATEQLRGTIAMAIEADFVTAEWDRIDDNLPTVERHEQNRFHDGVVFLVQLLSQALVKLGTEDRERARGFAEAWRELPSRIGLRLWFQAMRQPELYTADDVADAVLALPRADFWRVRRELVLAMAERLGGARQLTVDRISRRVIDEAATLYDAEFEVGPGQQDWRPPARDRNAWLRLAALKRAGVLNDESQAALAAIAERHPFISGDFEESDLFSSYSRGVRYISGDPEPIRRAADPAKRLEIAREAASAREPEARQNWSAYCRLDPAGALETLRQAPLTMENADLWSDLVGSMAWGPQKEALKARRERQKLARQVFESLSPGAEEFIQDLAARLTDLLPSARRAGLPLADEWWDRLWSAAEADDAPVDEEAPDRFYDHVINTSAGRLVEQLVTEIDKRKAKTRRLTPANRARLRRVMASDTSAGWLGRGICVSQVGFLFFIDPVGVRKQLKPWLARQDVQGLTLRSVLVEWARLGEGVQIALKDEILAAVGDSQATDQRGAVIANRLVRPLVLDVYDRAATPSSITRADVRGLLKSSAPSVLDGVAQALGQWITNSGRKPENAWRLAVGPIFQDVWPKERTFRNPAFTQALAQMVVNAGPAFPEALETVRHFLLPLQGGWAGITFLTKSATLLTHPRESLELLWILCGPKCEIRVWGLEEALKKISEADPRLVRDRRYQWMEQRAGHRE